MRKVVFAIIFGSGCLATIAMATCSAGSCPAVGYFFAVGRNMMDNYSLRHHVIAKFTVTGPNECFRKCRLDCNCISFSYRPTKNEKNCKLNKENRYTKPSALQQSPAGAQYYDLVIDYNVVKSEQRPPHARCANGCCRSQPCPPNFICEELCDVKGKRFRCVSQPLLDQPPVQND
ncbi:hypothetical protein OS493_032891 [Desmophyllum pertusum]|uniref:Apple domain-containing protein n=1 Tax=Desmophyllum pertusum TaxID=174260 RepID=A0A9X0CHS4_9CNID|nr:hypothetical protein OS493_032891 [Desmophyllum pertusum]